MDCRYLEEGASGSALLSNARPANRPLLGKGDPQDPIQTGDRKTGLNSRQRRSGAY